MAGATPTLTIGDAGAEDTKIVFDGNAQDYYMGLDDTDDDLKIGLGSAVGTTAHIVINEAGTVTMPLQPAFQAIPAGTQSDLAINTEVAVAFGTERFDIGSNFASNIFTAPVTGKYYLTTDLYMGSIDEGAEYYQLWLKTSNKIYYTLFSHAGGDTDVYQSMKICTLADMDAGDTSSVSILQSEGTAQVDIFNSSFFSGCLVT
jgi:hypothetical protein